MSEIFSKECEGMVEPDKKSNTLHALCGKKARVWDDLTSKKYGKDKTPYCIHCHAQEKRYWKSKCKHCGKKFMECMCE